MKGRLVGWIMAGVFTLVVVAIATRVPMIRGLVFGNAAKAA